MQKFLAVGCSHGNMINRKVADAVLGFQEKWKPDLTIHLGDFVDLAALRGGSSGSKDEAEDIDGDLKAGFEFLRSLRPKLVFMGNHEDRICRFVGHPNARFRKAAGGIRSEIDSLMKELKAQLVEYDIETGWKRLGDTLFGHGYMFNQSALRDHAETFGRCVIAHLHTVGHVQGRRHGGATAYCVGLVGDTKKMTYAKTNRNKLSWTNGLAYGTFDSRKCTVNLCEISASGQLPPMMG